MGCPRLLDGCLSPQIRVDEITVEVWECWVLTGTGVPVSGNQSLRTVAWWC